jgi:hypothetical protein
MHMQRLDLYAVTLHLIKIKDDFARIKSIGPFANNI